MLNSITQSPLFSKTYILAKQIKHIPKGSVTRAEIPRGIIYTDLI